MSRTRPNDHCKAFLEATRKVVGAKPEEKIYKRYGSDLGGYLAPNDKYYFGHCAYCAEVSYLQEIYADDDVNHAEED